MSGNPSGFNAENSSGVLRRSAAIPSRGGNFALYYEWTYPPAHHWNLTSYSLLDPFARHSNATSYYVLNISTGLSTLLPKSCRLLPKGSGFTNFIWMGTAERILCQAHANESTHFFTFDAQDIDDRSNRTLKHVGHVQGSISIFKAANFLQGCMVIGLSSRIIHGAPSASSTSNEHDDPVYFGTHNVYSAPHVSVLCFSKEDPEHCEIVNADVLENTGVECVPFSTHVLNESMNFDIASAGLVFVGRAQGQFQNQQPLSSDIFFIPINQLLVSDETTKISPIKIEVGHFSGSASMPVFNPGECWPRIAFLKSKDGSDIASKYSIFMASLPKGRTVNTLTCLLASIEFKNSVLNPEGIAWGAIENDRLAVSSRLFLWAAYKGYRRSFELYISPNVWLKNGGFERVSVTSLDNGLGMVSGVHHFACEKNEGGGRILITKTISSEGGIFVIYNQKRGIVTEVMYAGNGETMMEKYKQL